MTREIQVIEGAADRLDRLQAEIERETGRSVTRQELVARMVELARDQREDVVESFRPET